MRSARIVFIIAITINGFFLCREGAHAVALWSQARGLSNDQRRELIYGPAYADLAQARRDIPETATAWWVSPEYPWLANYFLYPRALRWGAPDASRREAFRAAHPKDWVIGYAADGQRLVALRPLAR